MENVGNYINKCVSPQVYSHKQILTQLQFLKSQIPNEYKIDQMQECEAPYAQPHLPCTRIGIYVSQIIRPNLFATE